MNKTDSAQLAQIKDKLQEAGFKLTSQREVTVEVMIEKEKKHLSAEEIYMEVKNKNAGIGLATVYRTLEILTELKILNKVSFQDGLARYDLNKSNKNHQPHHLLCLNCGNIEEVQEDLLDDIEEDIKERFNFTVKDHRLTFHGICSNCAAKGIE